MNNATDRKTVRVLLIEDDPADAEILTEALNEVNGASFRVTAVSRVADALTRLQGGRDFDVYLVDLKLPDAEGLDALDMVRKVVPDRPIVVMTGFDDDALACEAEHRGAVGYLVKGRVSVPYIRQVLLSALEHRPQRVRSAVGT